MSPARAAGAARGFSPYSTSVASLWLPGRGCRAIHELLVKLLACVTVASMLLSTYLLRGLHRRLGGLLETWRCDPGDRWSAVMRGSSK